VCTLLDTVGVKWTSSLGVKVKKKGEAMKSLDNNLIIFPRSENHVFTHSLVKSSVEYKICEDK